MSFMMILDYIDVDDVGHLNFYFSKRCSSCILGSEFVFIKSMSNQVKVKYTCDKVKCI